MKIRLRGNHNLIYASEEILDKTKTIDKIKRLYLQTWVIRLELFKPESFKLIEDLKQYLRMSYAVYK